MSVSTKNDHVLIKAFGITIEGTAGCAKLVTWLGFALLFLLVILIALAPSTIQGAWHYLSGGTGARQTLAAWESALGGLR